MKLPVDVSRLALFIAVGCLAATPTRAADPAKPEPMTVPGLGLAMVKIQHGTFTLGDPPSPNGRVGDTEPQTKVTLTKDFWLGATEVTVAQWRYFVKATGYITSAERSGDGIWISTLEKTPSPDYFGSEKREKREKRPGTNWQSPGFAQTENHPVVGLSWNDANQFCLWLNEREGTAGRLPSGYVYRLPTESQWEYAATMGGQPDPKNPDEYSWYRVNSGGTPHPVATKRASAWGLYDMQGNAWEWVHDWYGRYPGGSVTDFEGSTSANAREIIRPHRERRGGWANDPAGHGISTTNRWSSSGQDECNWVGFRVSLGPRPAAPAPTPAPGRGGGRPAHVSR